MTSRLGGALAQRLRLQCPSKSCTLLASRRWELQAAVLPVQSRRFFFGGRSDGGNKGDSSDQAEGETPATSSDTDKAERSGGGRRARSGRAGSNNGVAAQDGEGAIVPMKPDGHGQLRKDGGFEPWSIALPVFRRPLFPMQNHIIQVTSPTLTKELIRAFEKRPGQNYVSLFLHKQVPPAFEMPEKREDGEEAGEAAEGQVPQVQATAELEELGSENPMEVLCRVGTRAKVMQAMPVVSQSGQQVGLQMLVNGIDIVRMEEVLQKGPPLQVKISQVKYENEDPPDDMLKATMNETMQTIKEIMKVNPGFREYASLINQSYYDRVEKMKAHVVAHFAAALTSADGIDLQKVLEATNAQDKSRLALELVKKELELSKLQQKIASQIEDKMNKHQREFMLREQLKSIKKELGIDKDDGSDALLQKFKQRLEEKTVPKEVKEAIDQELEKFANLAKESQEYQMTRNYLEWLTNMPWGVYSKDTFDLKKAREILDRDHYGLADIKDRIREFIAVGVLRGSMQGKILCFVGPPGVGKTSIGKSIAEALGREFYRFSVGGLYDVAEIKGHRRTYVGAMPGKVIQCLKKTQTANPLILIDEVDKIGRGHQGDPSSALLELLDPSQNNSFVDHYLDVPVDCSNILFVCTANVLETIPGPLLDRMEVIRLTGYDLQEKMRIAQDYLVPNAMVEVGLRHKEVKTSEQATTAEAPPGEALTAAETSEASCDEANGISKAAETVKPTIKAEIEEAAIESLIRWYCREAGVRNLQKHIERVCRKLATKVVEQLEEKKSPDQADAAAGDDQVIEMHVDEGSLSDYVGKPVFTSDRLYEGALPPGTVTGLAWTALGGSVLYIEATALPRRSATAEGAPKAPPALAVTGQLGSVMKESSSIALLVARRQLAARGAGSFFEDHELFLHCPEGATPKDGPSAGVTMTTALLSLALEKPIATDLAMTGEVSLNGKVLAVGGIKEKTIAARRAGCKTLVFPQANRRDFEELPEYLRDGLTVHFATHFDDVFDVAFKADDIASESSGTA